MTSSLSCPLHTRLELEPCFRGQPRSKPFPTQSSWSTLRTLAPPPSLLLALPRGPHLPIKHPSLCSALPSSRSYLNSLCVLDRLSPCSEPHPAQPGTASSQHILAGGRSGFRCQPHSPVESAHSVVGAELSTAEGGGWGRAPRDGLAGAWGLCSLSLLVYSYHLPGGHGWGSRCCPSMNSAKDPAFPGVEGKMPCQLGRLFAAQGHQPILCSPGLGLLGL